MQRDSIVTVTSHLYREESVLGLRADFSAVVADFELHVLSAGLDFDPLSRQLVVDGLAALGLHLASRPVDESVGWTIHIQEPLISLFYVGSARTGDIVGRAFTEDVEPRPSALFIAQATREHGEPHYSTIEVDGVDVYRMVERFYEQSEQKIARFFHRDSRVSMLQSLPGSDEDWLRAATVEDAFRETDALDVLATREFRFRCGCDVDKITGILVGTYGDAPDALFEDEPEVRVECPRCGAGIVVTREDYERVRARD